MPIARSPLESPNKSQCMKHTQHRENQLQLLQRASGFRMPCDVHNAIGSARLAWRDSLRESGQKSQGTGERDTASAGLIRRRTTGGWLVWGAARAAVHHTRRHCINAILVTGTSFVYDGKHVFNQSYAHASALTSYDVEKLLKSRNMPCIAIS